MPLFDSVGQNGTNWRASTLNTTLFHDPKLLNNYDNAFFLICKNDVTELATKAIDTKGGKYFLKYTYQ